MEGNLSPRQIARGLLNGILPPRPLLLPIVFALGTKIENIKWDEYLQNPTKIVSALRQVRNHLQVDGIACYFDHNLEVEALGAKLESKLPGGWPEVNGRSSTRPVGMPGSLRSPEEAVKSGRIPVAVEVIRRMNAIPNREFLLIAVVAGPMALAAKIARGEVSENASGGELPAEGSELVSSMCTQTATAFLEAGADVILIYEEVPATLSPIDCEEWKNLVAPTINVARFYEALPLVQVRDGLGSLEFWQKIRDELDAVVCLPASASSWRSSLESVDAGRSAVGVALPVEALETGRAGSDEAIAKAREMIAQIRPCVITTDDDGPLTTDLSHLKRVLGEVCRPV